MFSCGFPAQGLLQFIGHISADEHSFAIGHFVRGLLVKIDATHGTPPLGSELSKKHEIAGNCHAIWDQVCKPNSVPDPMNQEVIIPLAQPLPVGSSDLPEGFERAALMTPSYLVLHREEFAWPRMSPHAPVRSYF